MLPTMDNQKRQEESADDKNDENGYKSSPFTKINPNTVSQSRFKTAGDDKEQASLPNADLQRKALKSGKLMSFADERDLKSDRVKHQMIIGNLKLPQVFNFREGGKESLRKNVVNWNYLNEIGFEKSFDGLQNSEQYHGPIFSRTKVYKRKDLNSPNPSQATDQENTYCNPKVFQPSNNQERVSRSCPKPLSLDNKSTR
jgi:hypothetical protein